MIYFNKPPLTGNEQQYVLEAMSSNKMSGDGNFSKRCQAWFEDRLGNGCRTLLTPSCTHALEMAAILIDVKQGDEIIMPSYTFVSTANAFVLRGATIVFVDINPLTMNIDDTLIEEAITERTKAIVPVHYAGTSCDMDNVMSIAQKHGLIVIEDAAQGVMSSYKGKPLGTIGHLAAFSFHETKNYTSGGEGGLLIVNDDTYFERAEIIREKGTNRSKFFRGMVDKYSWVDVGSSYLPCELQAAYLWGQLEKAEEINSNRLSTWTSYADGLSDLIGRGLIECMNIPKEVEHNAHMFYIKLKDIDDRSAMIEHLKNNGVLSVFHYVPLHSATAAKRSSRFSGEDKYTTIESERLLRLPLYYGMSASDCSCVISAVNSFFE